MTARCFLFVALLAGCGGDAPATPDARVLGRADAAQEPAPAAPSPPPLPDVQPCACTVVGTSEYSSMAQPFTRNNTYVAGVSQVEASDLNDLQDQNIANIGDLITSLGGVAPDDLNDMIRHGTFTPVIVIANQANVVYTVQTGAYLRIGPWVFARVAVAYTNNDNTINASVATILAPYACEATNAYNGVIDYADSDFGTANATITTAGLRISSAQGGIQVHGKATTMGSSDISIAYGDSDARKIVGSLWYKTNGTFNY